MSKKWRSGIPDGCAFCGRPILHQFIYGKTNEKIGGWWAIMCSGCHGKCGVGFGVDHGYLFVHDPKTGNWCEEEPKKGTLFGYDGQKIH